nr:AAA family ATPase [Methylobacterium sp. P1-11]
MVQDLISETGKGLMPGQWGCGKTFTAIDLSASVMTGQPFAGRRVIRQGGVLFVARSASAASSRASSAPNPTSTCLSLG